MRVPQNSASSQSGEETAGVPLIFPSRGQDLGCFEGMMCAPRKAVISAGIILLIHMFVHACVCMQILLWILYLQCDNSLLLLLLYYQVFCAVQWFFQQVQLKLSVLPQKRECDTQTTHFRKPGWILNSPTRYYFVSVPTSRRNQSSVFF